MPKRVVGEEIHEDVALIHTRDEANSALTNAKRKRDRLNAQVVNHNTAIALLDAEITSWETAIRGLPALPEPPPAPSSEAPEIPPA